MSTTTSPFLHPGAKSTVDSLSIIHLKRDLQVPTVLKDHDEEDEGYLEGKVVNTRFGSFPHTTLIDLPWGTQVRASKVDTGSRGRRAQAQGQDKKRKREESAVSNVASKKIKSEETNEGENESVPATPKEDAEAIAASSGFIHLLPPTPESWTSSLPHRTQVVYTPDYSYILHRIRARPGTNLIEAGAGSGSFTHASARAVFNGYPKAEDTATAIGKQKLGKVWSYEFHKQRHQMLKEEIKEHGLNGVVQITHRDVCENGFLVDEQSPGAEAIFLDLPAPWLALPHLARSKTSPSKPSPPVPTSAEFSSNGTTDPVPDSTQDFISPLNPKATVYICTFSPCIEQVQKTVSTLRHLGWTDIEMVEIAAKRFEIRRERLGIDNGVERGTQVAPANVDEALTRLLEVEGNFQSFHSNGSKSESSRKEKANPNSRAKIIENLVERKIYKEGRLVHRTEPEIKTHTSYLVFAVLPREWSAEQEQEAKIKWPVKVREKQKVIGMSRRQERHAENQVNREKAVARKEADAKAKAKAEAEGEKSELEPQPGTSEWKDGMDVDQ